MKDEENISSGLTVNSVFNHSFFSIILKRQEKLNLSTEQTEKLKKLQSEFRRETLKGNTELQVAEIELNPQETTSRSKGSRDRNRRSDRYKTLTALINQEES